MNTRNVYIKSDQTSKTKGNIIKVEYDRVWGPQYLVEVEDKNWGTETFWMKKAEIMQ